jgi:hypothetical protein
LTLEPDGQATGCNPVEVGSIPTGVSWRPTAGSDYICTMSRLGTFFVGCLDPTAAWESMRLTDRGFTGFEPRQKKLSANFVGLLVMTLAEATPGRSTSVIGSNPIAPSAGLRGGA